MRHLGSEQQASSLSGVRASSGCAPAAMLRGMEVMTVLYRPVGQREYELIVESGFRRFPPRFAEQPYFYPVTNEEYATQIACDWNTQDERSGR